MICSLCLVSQRKITHNSAISAKYISILLLSDYRYCLSPSHRVPTLQSLLISTYGDTIHFTGGLAVFTIG